MKYFNKVLIFTFSIFLVTNTYSNESKLAKRADLQKKFFSYAKVIFKWSQELQRLMESDDKKESLRGNLDLKLSTEVSNAISHDLTQFREFLLEQKPNDLNKLRDDADREYDLIPDEIYGYIRKSLLQGEVSTKDFINAIAGEAIEDKDGKWIVKKSLLTEIQNFEIIKWPPVKRFIDNFTATVFEDERMAASIGNLLHPFVKLYFNYQDNVSRARIFEDLATHWNRINLTGDTDTDLDILASRIFQNGGPVLVKFFQILKEESKNSSDLPIKRVLLELKNIPPMDEQAAGKLAAEYIVTTTPYKKLNKNNFGWGDYLAIASIGETHLVQIGEKTIREDYVMKIHRQGISEIFEREVLSIERMFNAEESNQLFDKGLKHSIFNMIKGIREELDFRFERHNIKLGLDAYSTRLKHPYLSTIDIPQIVNSTESNNSKKQRPYANANQHVMVMTKAKGTELAAILESNNPQEVLMAYNGMVQLYRDYFTVALDPAHRPNFYHGDLHAGNIFMDFETIPDQAHITLIDFGRAGQLTSDKQEAMINIMLKTKEISKSFFDKSQNKSIMALAQELEQFLLDSFEEPGAGLISQVNAMGLKSYFRVCFNPDALPSYRADAQSVLNIEAEKLRNLRGQLRKNALPPQLDKEIKIRLAKMKEQEANGNSNSLRKKLFSYRKGELSPGYQNFIDDIQDQIDFINALNLHCMTDIESKLLIPLKDKKMLVSDKLKIVFKDMQRNGIPIPEDMIFFNKSKSLLEGIINNLMDQLTKQSIDYKRVSVEEIFTSTIEKIRKSINVVSRQKAKI